MYPEYRLFVSLTFLLVLFLNFKKTHIRTHTDKHKFLHALYTVKNAITFPTAFLIHNKFRDKIWGNCFVFIITAIKKVE